LEDELKCIFDALGKRIDDLRREFLLLREADRSSYDTAIEVAYQGVRDRMEGFPEQYATKPDMDGVKEALQRLEKDAISREIYDTQYAALDELVRRLDKDKMDEKEFNTFVTTQRAKDEEAANERRAVAAGLARSTETVAQTLAARDERQKGVTDTKRAIAVTRGQVVAIVSAGVGVIGLISILANVFSA
jgi:hypothetical protein